MQLFYAPGTIAIAAAIALNEAGLACEATRLDFKAGAQSSPDYLAVNPKGRVPALVTDQGVLTETGAILDYIAAIAPEAGLVPEDPFQAGRMREAMYYFASTMHVNHAHKLRGHRWADDPAAHAAMAAKVPETMSESAAYAETLVQGPYVLGEKLSLADPYLFMMCRWLPGDGVPLTPYPRLTAFVAAMEARPSVQKAIAAGMLP